MRASASCSRRAATNALDSIYRTPGVSAVEAAVLALRFATIGVNQLGGSSSRKSDVGPAFCRVTGLERRANHSGGDELVETARPTLRLSARRNKLGDDSAVSSNGNTLSGLDPPYVAAQVVFELANACGSHQEIIATCGHIPQPGPLPPDRSTCRALVADRRHVSGRLVSRPSRPSRPPAEPRSGDLRHLREQSLIRTVRMEDRKDVAAVLTKHGRSLLESHRCDRPRVCHVGRAYRVAIGWESPSRESGS